MSGDHQQQQQELGKGRPDRREATLDQRPVPSATQTSPANALPRAKGLTIGRSPSILSTTTYAEEDEHPGRQRPRTAIPMSTGDQTPRTGGAQRGLPQPALGSSFGSPGLQPSSGGSLSRPPRAARYNTTTPYPVSHPVNPMNASHTIQSAGMGSMSRSASRARPPLHTQNTLAVMAPAAAPQRAGRDNQEGDEVEVEDRGAELIRRRQKERKQLRRAKEREKRLAEGDGKTPDTSAPPTGQPGESFATQQSHSLGLAAGRSVSRARASSQDPPYDRRRDPSEGYFSSRYASSTIGSETPRDGGLSPHEDTRPASLYSTVADEEEEEQEQEQEPDNRSVLEDVEEVVNASGAEVDELEELEEEEEEEEEEDEEDESGEGDDEGVTLKDRQDAINIEHPFGLPIWKPALYRKSRSITRNAENALHSIPSAAAERHLLPGNLLWVIVFGWWLAITCFVVAVLVSGAEVLGGGRGGYGKTLRGLTWYIGWPFGKYVEGEGAPEEDGEIPDQNHEEGQYGTWNGDGSPVAAQRERRRQPSDGASSGVTVRDGPRKSSLAHSLSSGLPDEPRPGPGVTDIPIQSSATLRPGDVERREPTVSFAPNVESTATASLRHFGGDSERAPLLGKIGFRRPRNRKAKILGRIVYWPLFVLIVAPIMLFVCLLCWGMVITIPMAKLTWALLELLYLRPLEINFRSAPKIIVPTSPGSPSSGDGSGDTTAVSDGSPSGFTLKRAHLTAGQVAPTSGPKSTVLLCTYRAIGLQYYKYTVGGVNIMFINLMPLVFFTIIDGLLLLPYVERAEHRGHTPSPFVALITSQALIFFLSLASVIPLSYFIGMAVASISAQSSIGMGAVINATFGSIIEIILYGIALTQGKGRLVEGSIVGSILAGVLLMPGASMCSGALKRKEQRFNAKSAGVTSTMLIMAIIGTLTPTMFYQTYGSFELHCQGCPEVSPDASVTANTTLLPDQAWMCNHCYYEHPDPAVDPFYQDQVKTLMYCCAVILLFSYLIGLWFSLRTHASQIWQNPQQLMKPPEEVLHGAMHPAHKASLYQRVTPQTVLQHVLPMHQKSTSGGPSTPSAPLSQTSTLRLPPHAGPRTAPFPAEGIRERERSASRQCYLPQGYTPFLEGVNQDMKSRLTPMRLPSTLTTEDFTRAVAVATASALRHQGSIVGSQTASAQKARHAHETTQGTKEEEEHEGGGHEAPSWTRGMSAGVLLSCTLLYAIIAEILVDVVDVVLHGSGIDEKFLGLTLFALVPNTTEFMNAMSFAMTGNIALSMEIGSAYALQVCLLQIPAMVAFSAFYDPGKMGEVVDTFTLIFPRWDVIAIILSIFLLTYTYIEARSNYHRGSILVLAYVVLMMGFYFAPVRNTGNDADNLIEPEILFGTESLAVAQASWGAMVSKLWA